MTKKATDIWAYMGWPGFIVALCQPCKDECKFHINQALVFNIFFTGLSLISWIGVIPYIGWLLEVYVFMPVAICLLVFWVIALVGACHQEEKKAPLIGSINIMNH